jgi:hypothetical protein
MPDNCLTIANVGSVVNNDDVTSGTVKFTSDDNRNFAGRCAIEINAPKNCELGFRVKTFDTDNVLDFWGIDFRWPSGRGSDDGGPIQSSSINDDDSLADFNKQYISNGWVETEKDLLRINYYNNDYNLGRSGNWEFEVEWKCFGEPEVQALTDICRTTSSDFGEVGWYKRIGREYKERLIYCISFIILFLILFILLIMSGGG